jgi:hypothetical protein
MLYSASFKYTDIRDQEEASMKRLILASGTTALLVVAFGGVVSAAAAPTVERFPVSFTITSQACSNLPRGARITGSGSETSITKTKNNSDGTTTLENLSIAIGTALDNRGNVYGWLYVNSFHASNTVADPAVFSGHMNDSFILLGRGPIRLNNGFVGNFVTDFSTFFTVPDVKSSHGDPIDFVTGEAHCDPL